MFVEFASGLLCLICASVLCKLLPNMWASTSGAKLEPPIPNRTTCSKCVGNFTGVRSCPPCCSGLKAASSHPIQLASSSLVHKVASFDHNRCTLRCAVQCSSCNRSSRTDCACLSCCSLQCKGPASKCASCALFCPLLG